MSAPASPLDAVLAAGGTVVVPGLLNWLGRSGAVDPDLKASVDGGFTESFEAYCDRISRKEAGTP